MITNQISCHISCIMLGNFENRNNQLLDSFWFFMSLKLLLHTKPKHL